MNESLRKASHHNALISNSLVSNMDYIFCCSVSFQYEKFLLFAKYTNNIMMHVFWKIKHLESKTLNISEVVNYPMMIAGK